ncbi:MAG: alpha-2-macroglobulin family protein [Alphaproteobacteria bacterium]|nr:alpha-2-macroglobulin family protein [Alphaproteobacteria bacterium]
MNSRIFAIVLGLIVLAGAAFGLWFAFAPHSGPGGGVAVTDPQGATTPTITAQPYQEPVAPRFAFRRLEIDTGTDAAEACLVFTRKLDSSGKTRYEDYLRFDPAVPVAVRASDDRLCVGGLAFNETYTLEIRQGLPAASGEKLDMAETIPVRLRDQDPQVAFGAGFILPRESLAGVPITTVNAPVLNIRVLRVGDRMISQLRTAIVDERQMYPYDEREYEEEKGALVWEGKFEAAGPRNQAMTTLFPLKDALANQKPGVYLVIAKIAKEGETSEEGDDYWDPNAAQWIINTDIGITTFQGDDGLTVYTRSFQTAAVMSEVKLSLVARNNEILGEVSTDSQGRAVFDAGLMRGKGGNEPVAVLAYGAGGDFAYQDLRRPAFDLTDRGVEGRAAPGPIDAFMYLDRGIYRPGETVNLTTMLRDRRADAKDDMPLIIVVQRPDGSVFRRFTQSDQSAGSGLVSFTLTATSPRGRWGAAAYLDEKGEPISRIGFDVQDFVPQRLKLELAAKQEVLSPGATVEIGVFARFLYGAPAAGLAGEGEITVKRDANPYPAFKGYSWGRVDDNFDAVITAMTVEPTDANGKTAAIGSLDQLAETSLPLRAMIRVSLFEPGGRTTPDTLDIPVRTRDIMLGLKPMFEGDSVRENTEASFEVIAVDRNGKQAARKGVTFELVREEYDYRWYRTQEGDWRYQEIRSDRIVSGGSIDLAADLPAKIGQPLEWGQYRLTVIDPTTGASTALRFWSGWGAGAANDRPDRVAVIADKEKYKPGETATLEIRAATDGKALVAIATDRIVATQLIDVSASGTKVQIPVSADWGSGAYALVTHYRPLASAQGRAPVRSIGLVWLGVDTSERTLNVAIDAPETVTPRAPLDVTITVANAESAEGYVTLAAVDEGILQLTDFKSPDPAAYYYGKRQLGVDVRDDYGRLILPANAQVGEARSGGDGFGGRGLAVVPTRTVALFSGIVKLDAQGQAKVTLDIPDFNGELRLMAVAFGPSRVGSFSRPLTVRDAVVGEVVLPRFMAPGDRVTAALNMHNVSGVAGRYTATVKADGPVLVPGGKLTLAQELSVGQRVLLPVGFEANATGIASITLTLEGPNGYKVERAWPIEVRAPQLPLSRDIIAEVKPGEEVKLGSELLQGLIPGTESVAVALAGAKGFDNVAGMLRWLDRYPYGCLEQTTSRAFPLVFYNDMALLANVKQDEKIEGRVQLAIDRVLDMQMWSGGFGLWMGSSEETDQWLQAYAIDFLMQAKAKGYVVPREGLDRATNWLKQMAASDSANDNARAYAYYLLARAGVVNASDLRYFADNRGANVSTAMGAGMMGVALTQIGDKARASVAYARARQIGTELPLSFYSPYSFYDTNLRDLAGAIRMVAEGGQQSFIPALIDRAKTFNFDLNWTTTQEKAWMLLAANAIESNAAQVKADVRGVSGLTTGRIMRFSPTAQELAQGVSFRNNGDKPIWQTVSIDGVPSQLLPAEATGGLQVQKGFLTLDGQPADLAAMAQNDRLIVLITGSAIDNEFRQMAVLDLLPAGWQIEAPVQRNDDGSSQYGFLPTLTPLSIEESRDDRYVAAFTIGDRYRDPRANTYSPQFTLAYIVRATTPGTYVLPAVSAEDMYAPTVRARTAPGSVTIKGAP